MAIKDLDSVVTLGSKGGETRGRRTKMTGDSFRGRIRLDDGVHHWLGCLTWMTWAARLMLRKSFLSRTALKRRCSATIRRSTSWWRRVWRRWRSASRRNTCETNKQQKKNIWLRLVIRSQKGEKARSRDAAPWCGPLGSRQVGGGSVWRSPWCRTWLGWCLEAAGCESDAQIPAKQEVWRIFWRAAGWVLVGVKEEALPGRCIWCCILIVWCGRFPACPCTSAVWAPGCHWNAVEAGEERDTRGRQRVSAMKKKRKKTAAPSTV